MRCGSRAAQLRRPGKLLDGAAGDLPAAPLQDLMILTITWC